MAELEYDGLPATVMSAEMTSTRMIAGRTDMSNGFDLQRVDVEFSPEQQFSEYLHTQGKRVTQQRRRILETIYSHHDHFDAEELLDHLRGAAARGEVSRATVYRTLAELVEAGILRRVQVEANGRSLYEHQYAYPAHDHLICEVCNRLIEFHAEELERIGRLAAKSHRFKMRGHRMVVVGICRECDNRE
jgi:Fur family ferric uptake transcriptional regulator